MPGRDREIWRVDVAFDGVQVGVADAAHVDFDAHLSCYWFRDGDFFFEKRVVFDFIGGMEAVCFHTSIVQQFIFTRAR